jgi:hypothetical protein
MRSSQAGPRALPVESMRTHHEEMSTREIAE